MADQVGDNVGRFEVRGRDVTILTQPREAGPAAPATGPDPVESWFRENAPGGDRENAAPRKIK